MSQRHKGGFPFKENVPWTGKEKTIFRRHEHKFYVVNFNISMWTGKENCLSLTW